MEKSPFQDDLKMEKFQNGLFQFLHAEINGIEDLPSEEKIYKHLQRLENMYADIKENQEVLVENTSYSASVLENVYSKKGSSNARAHDETPQQRSEAAKENVEKNTKNSETSGRSSPAPAGFIKIKLEDDLGYNDEPVPTANVEQETEESIESSELDESESPSPQLGNRQATNPVQNAALRLERLNMARKRALPNASRHMPEWKRYLMQQDSSLLPAPIQKDYMCDICGKAFITEKSLMCHKKGHAPPKRKAYECEQCHRRFSAPSELKQHEMTHLGELGKIHECSLCGRRFNRISNLYRHERNQHGVQVPTA